MTGLNAIRQGERVSEWAAWLGPQPEAAEDDGGLIAIRQGERVSEWAAWLGPQAEAVLLLPLLDRQPLRFFTRPSRLAPQFGAGLGHASRRAAHQQHPAVFQQGRGVVSP